MRNVLVSFSLMAAYVLFAAGGCSSSKESTAPTDGGLASETGDGALDPAITKSGSRLEVHVSQVGGVEIFDHLFDKKLGAACAFRAASDGSLRCVPGAFEAAALFADKGCTARLTVSPAGCEAAPFFFDATPCEPKARVFRRGAPTQPASVYSCPGSPGSPVPNTTYFAAGDELAPTDLVSAEVRTVATADGVMTEIFAGEDGSHALARYRDAGRNVQCAPLKLTDGAFHCVPTPSKPSVFDSPSFLGGTVLSSNFADSACTKGTIQAGYGICGQTVGLMPDPDALDCRTSDKEQRPVRVFEEGAPAKDFFYLSGTTCTATGSGGSGATAGYYEVGPEVPAASLPTLANAPDSAASGARIVERRIAVPGGTETVALFDTQNSSVCHLDVAEDGKKRCLPEAMGELGMPLLFTDATCTTPVVATPCKAANLAPFVVELLRPTPCATLRRIRPRGEKIAKPAQVWQSVSGSCQPFSPSPGDYYAVGAPIAPTDFAEAVDAVR